MACASAATVAGMAGAHQLVSQSKASSSLGV